MSRELIDTLFVARYDLQTNLRKTNSDRLADLIANYDEVAEVLTGTQYAHFLD